MPAEPRQCADPRYPLSEDSCCAITDSASLREHDRQRLLLQSSLHRCPTRLAQGIQLGYPPLEFLNGRESEGAPTKVDELATGGEATGRGDMGRHGG